MLKTEKFVCCLFFGNFSFVKCSSLAKDSIGSESTILEGGIGGIA